MDLHIPAARKARRAAGVQAAVAEALRGARAVVVAGKLGPHLLRLAAATQVEHLVLPSLAGAVAAGHRAAALVLHLSHVLSRAG